MRLTSVSIAGIRGIDREVVDLSPVTTFWGPNGSGKTSIAGAVAFALTGRFPGLVVPGKPAGGTEVLSKLATDATQGFSVRLSMADPNGSRGWVERGLAGGKSKLSVSWLNERASGAEAAEQLLFRLVGDVSWAIDMFDPEKSIWRMSPEKRKAWALGICASASGWSTKQLIGAIGPETNDWNPSLHSDAGVCLEMNMQTVDSRLKAAQKVVREAIVITEGVSAEREADVQAEIDKLECKIASVNSEAQRLSRLLASADTEQATIDRDRRARALLIPQIENLKSRLSAQVPPPPPQLPAQALQDLDQIDMDMVCVLVDETEERELQVQLGSECAVLESDIQSLDRYSKLAGESGRCPVCGTTGPWKGADAFASRVAQLRARKQETLLRAAANQKRLEDLNALRMDLEQKRRSLELSVALYNEELTAHADRCAKFESSFEALANTIQTLEEQLARVPPDRPNVDSSALSEKLSATQAELAQLTAQVNEQRQKLGVAAHRQGQLSAQSSAERRVEQLKDLLVTMRKARDRMLDDASAPLRRALESLEVVCLNGWQWTLRRDGTALDMVMQRESRSLTVESLSAGERYLATIALLVAKSIVRREPWSGLFLDNFEAIFPDNRRLAVIRGLVTLCEMTNSPVDNVLVAGACEAPSDITGFKSYVRE